MFKNKKKANTRKSKASSSSGKARKTKSSNESKKPNRKRTKSTQKTSGKRRSTTPKATKKGKITSKKTTPVKRGKRGSSSSLKKSGKKRTAPKKPSPKTTVMKKAKLKKSTRKSKTSTGHAPPIKPPFTAYKGTKTYLFTSYAHENMKTVFKIIKQLNRSRYRIWYDEGIEPGNEWPEVVGKAVIKCSQFLVFMSPYASASRNVRNEINLAFNENKDILVVFLKNTRLSEGMKLQIGTVQFINKYELTENEFINALKKVLKVDIRN